ncbi:FAD-binding oxidoreductase [Alicyclobacillus cycloheptanicus]|nr:FAD-binding oxidoreductase [Alicyclobacillus cycloheptanicus]
MDGNVNPLRLVDAYRRAALRQGARYTFYNPVQEIVERRGGFTIVTARAAIQAKNVVIAAGIWSKAIGEKLNLSIPVRPVRGQILITEPLQPLLKYTMSGMRQTQNGEVLIGYSKEEAGMDRRTTLRVVRQTVQMAIEAVPKLETAKLVRAFSGLRVMPQDGLPILGVIPEHPGLYVAVMHSGYTLSPLVGTVIAEFIVDGQPSISIDEYSITRFLQ